MTVNGIKYLSSIFDYSGYGEASRNCIKSLLHTKTPITLEPLLYDSAPSTTYGDFGEVLNSMVNRDVKYSHKILHCTPEHYPKYRESGVKNVGFLYWETSKIPNEWVTYINECVDAQLVCCDYTKDVLQACGVTVPIYKVLPPFDFTEFVDIPPLDLGGVDNDMFVFYSIFQWAERKNPTGLLLSYFTEFGPKDNVILILKTYRSNMSEEEQQAIKSHISLVKASLGLSYYPKILFIGGLLTRDEIKGLHAVGDCCVIPSKSEGLGMPHAEAMASGNPVIATNLGGHLEFMNNGNGYLVRCKLEPVMGMPWIPWYRGDQLWADPDIMEIRKYMREAYTDRSALRLKGGKAQLTIKEKLDMQKIGFDFINVLEQI